MEYIVNWDKVSSLEDIIQILKLSNIIITDPSVEILEKGFLSPRINPYTVPGTPKPKRISKKEKAIIQTFKEDNGLTNLIKNL